MIKYVLMMCIIANSSLFGMEKPEDLMRLYDAYESASNVAFRPLTDYAVAYHNANEEVVQTSTSAKYAILIPQSDSEDSDDDEDDDEDDEDDEDTRNNKLLRISDADIVQRIGNLKNIKLYKSDKDGLYYLTDMSKKTTLETRAELYLHLYDNITKLQSVDSKLFNQISKKLLESNATNILDFNSNAEIVKYSGMIKALHMLNLAEGKAYHRLNEAASNEIELTRIPRVINRNIVHILQNTLNT